MSKNKLEFIKLLFSSDREISDKIKIDKGSIIINDEIFGELIQRLKEDKTTILPYKDQNKFYWLIVNDNKIELIKHKKEIIDLVVDDYGEIINFSLQNFNTNTQIGEIGARLFPNGYAFFTSPKTKKIFNKILVAIDLWMTIDNKRPEIKENYSKSNVYSLRSNFHQAIALKNWEKAEDCFNELKDKRYIADYNIYFLKVKLLSSQDKWIEIWEDDIYNHLTKFKPLPKKVRKSLLIAFYNAEIKLLEEKNADIIEIYNKFEDFSEKLGPIINYRSGLSGEVIYRLFTYKYYFDNELERLNDIKNETENKNTLELIDRLSNKISEPQKRKIPENNNDILIKARELIEEEKYDDAVIYVLDMDSSDAKAKLLMNIAVMTEDKEVIDLAKEEYMRLEKEERESFTSNPNTKAQVRMILGYNIELEENIEVSPLINNWIDWFGAVKNNYSPGVLAESLENIITKDDYSKWNVDQIKKIEDIIIELIVDNQLDAKIIRILNRGISDFTGYLLQDPQYPNNFADNLYLSILWALNKFCNKNKSNTKMLFRISEGILTINLEKRNEVWDHAADWFEMQPIMNLKNYVFDTLELFYDYGHDNRLLANLWINWVGSLINSFANLNQIEIELWHQLGENIKADTKLLNILQKEISAKDQNKDINYFEKLDREIITIFTFREKPAKRVKDKIESINPDVTIRICTDSKLTSRAEDYAQNSDINIITTDCISHTLTYGISPYLKEDSLIYPRSSGQSAILDSIENHLKEMA